MSSQASRNPPGTDAISYFFDSELSVEIDEIDWKLHEKGMHGFARHDPHSLSVRECFAAEQAFRAFGAAVRQLRMIGKFRRSRSITNDDTRLIRGFEGTSDSAHGRSQ
jgi:hypothetical protein